MRGRPDERSPGGLAGTGASKSQLRQQQRPSCSKFRPASQPRRARFARSMVFEVFRYRDARAIDYDDFIDRKPNQAPRPSPEVWHMANGWAAA